jgi:hypothetical protein
MEVDLISQTWTLQILVKHSENHIEIMTQPFCINFSDTAALYKFPKFIGKPILQISWLPISPSTHHHDHKVVQGMMQ